MMSEVNINQIREDIFRATPKQLVADIIAANHVDVRITDKLIESYVSLALTKQFTLDKTICEIRKLDSFDSAAAGTITFVLDDASKVSVSETMYTTICENINSLDVVQFMRQSKDNFISVVNIIKEEQE